MKIKVKTNFTTFFECEVDADSATEAKIKATEIFWNTPDDEIRAIFFRNRGFVDEECSIIDLQ